MKCIEFHRNLIEILKSLIFPSYSIKKEKTVSGRRHVGIMGVEQVGNYAIKIKFDDMHDTGIFSWDTLYDFGEREAELWDGYLTDLKNKGLSRDP